VRDPTQDLGPIGSAVLAFIGCKQYFLECSNMSDVSADISEWKTEEDFHIDVHNFLEINLVEKQEEIDIIEETVRFSLFIHFIPRFISSFQFLFYFYFIFLKI